MDKKYTGFRNKFLSFVEKVKTKLLLIVLLILSFTSIFLALKTSNEPILRIFRNTWIDLLFQQFHTGNSLIFNLTMGFLVSVIFYLLVVWFPKRQRKNLIKHNFQKQYRFFKEDTISILLFACENSCASILPKKLSAQNEFKIYFKESVNESQDRWHVVWNKLDSDKRFIKDILVELEILMREVEYILNNVNINNSNVFSFFRLLSRNVYKLKNTTPGGDDVKQLLSFLWGLFTGWSFIDGYREDDIIEVMIKCI